MFIYCGPVWSMAHRVGGPRLFMALDLPFKILYGFRNTDVT
ncbi:MAG: hypothetical protein PHI96_10165 [Desulfovibrio sp.]|nr:hypothetical protein [Desulfovibrio sp.]